MAAPAVPVLLIPGLWAPVATMSLLARRLSKAGFAPYRFPWHSWSEPLADSVTRLHAAVAGMDAPDVHMIGHSLGGLLLAAYHAGPDTRPGRAVALGTPFSGSCVAQWLDHLPAGHVLLGSNRQLLQRGTDAWPSDRDLGVIAGDRPWGLGRLMPRLASTPSDGVVTVAETAIGGARDRIVVGATHTTLLLSQKVADHGVHFLHHGHFPKACRRPRC